MKIMQWLYEKECHWGKENFEGAAKHGDLREMIWFENGGYPSKEDPSRSLTSKHIVDRRSQEAS